MSRIFKDFGKLRNKLILIEQSQFFLKRQILLFLLDIVSTVTKF